MNKSLVTNVASVALIGVGYVTHSELCRTVGLFAASGGLTNWLAIYMLFERVPLLYGSGVIPARFEEFKLGIRKLIMEQFFTRANVERFLADPGTMKLEGAALADAVDYDQVFEQLIAAIQESPLGGLLGMFGGVRALDPIKAPFQVKMRSTVEKMANSPRFQEALAHSGSAVSASVIQNAEAIVAARLDELTPQMVKEIVQDMIRQHLGWLVVWGGVFGALMGLAAHWLA